MGRAAVVQLDQEVECPQGLEEVHQQDLMAGSRRDQEVECPQGLEAAFQLGQAEAYRQDLEEDFQLDLVAGSRRDQEEVFRGVQAVECRPDQPST